jgi:hypothetical protein
MYLALIAVRKRLAVLHSRKLKALQQWKMEYKNRML